MSSTPTRLWKGDRHCAIACGAACAAALGPHQGCCRRLTGRIPPQVWRGLAASVRDVHGPSPRDQGPSPHSPCTESVQLAPARCSLAECSACRLMTEPGTRLQVWNTKSVEGVHRFLARAWRLLADGVEDVDASTEQLKARAALPPPLPALLALPHGGRLITCCGGGCGGQCNVRRLLPPWSRR